VGARTPKPLMPQGYGGGHCAARQGRNEWPFSLWGACRELDALACRGRRPTTISPACYRWTAMRRVTAQESVSGARAVRSGFVMKASRGGGSGQPARLRAVPFAAVLLACSASCGAFTGTVAPSGEDAAAATTDASAGIDAAASDSAGDAVGPIDGGGPSADAGSPKEFTCGSTPCTRCCTGRDGAGATCPGVGVDCPRSEIKCTSSAQCELGSRCLVKLSGAGPDVAIAECQTKPPAADLRPACETGSRCETAETCVRADCMGVVLSVCLPNPGSTTLRCKK
jgi:hypothetical protein